VGIRQSVSESIGEFKRGKWKSRFETLFAGLVLAGVGVLVWRGQADTRVILPEIKINLPSNPWIGSDEIHRWMGPVVGEIAVKYRDIEAKILSHDWIKSVQLIEPKPDVLEVKPEVRIPVALWQHENGVSYVDGAGEVFGDLDLQKSSELPVASGKNPKRVVEWIENWKTRELDRWATLASVHEQSEDEIRAMLLPWRATLHWETKDMELSSAQWSQVLQYLQQHHVTPRQIWVQDATPTTSKKIVVKIVSSS
jgi:hypothetical protein